jgi:hypothetical protein
VKRVNKKLLGVLSISTGIIAVLLGLIFYRQYKPQYVASLSTKPPVQDPFLPTPLTTAESVLVGTVSKQKQKKPQPITAELMPTPTPLPWMEFNGVSLIDSPTNMSFEPICGDAQVIMPQFQVLPWTPEVFTNGNFDIDKNTVVAWEHLGYTGLWVHSGTDWLGNPLAAYPLQVFLENHESGRLRTTEEFEQFVNECFIGSIVNIQTDGQLVQGKVTALARIAPADVKEASTHTMDLVPYLEENYPNEGFDQLKPQDLLLYFCGRKLTKEAGDPDYSYFTQARIIIAIEPIK